MQIIAPRRDVNDPRYFEYKGVRYPEYCRRGPASRFVREFALEFCQGRGINIGYGRQDWNFFPAHTLLLDIASGHDCNRITRIPGIEKESFDFIFSSHTLEHLDDWKESLADWTQCLKIGGSLFLYLPHPSMEYWQPQNNTKHKHILVPELVCAYLQTLHMGDILCSGVDLYYSFCVTGVRCPVSVRPGAHDSARTLRNLSAPVTGEIDRAAVLRGDELRLDKSPALTGFSSDRPCRDSYM